MVDKQIRTGFKRIRAMVNKQEEYILKADLKADRERERLKKKLKKY